MTLPRDVVVRSLPWIGLAALAAIVVWLRLQVSFDISAFFPGRTDLVHKVLLEQFRNGPGSRLIVIGLNGAPQSELMRMSDGLRTTLAADPRFAIVHNGTASNEVGEIPEPVRSYYLLLDDVDYGRPALAAALHDRLRDVALGGSPELLDLIERDPFLIIPDKLSRLAPVDLTGDYWFAGDGSAVLMAETRDSALDLAAQSDAVGAIRAAFTDLAQDSGARLEVTGVGPFGVELQDVIRAEATKRSILASAALCAVLLAVYRSFRYLAIAALPLGMGFLAGLAAVSLLFANVHGVTIAFGFTLMGVAIDYPLHLFSHARTGGRSAIGRIWPTMRLGVVSTGLAYLALAASGSAGLAQLGTFTVAGLVVAAAATRLWLPHLLPDVTAPAETAAAPARPVLSLVPAALALAAALLSIGWNVDDAGLWDDRLSSLSPVPERRLERDLLLRSAAGTPSMQLQLAMYDGSLESVLQRSEAMDRHLAEAASDGLVENWYSVTPLLPSRNVQAARQAAIPDAADLSGRLAAVTADLPFRADAFAPFVTAAAAAKTLPPLDPSGFSDTALESWLDAHLTQIGDQWVALTTLVGADAGALMKRLSACDAQIDLIDLRASAAGLMRDYRSTAIRTVLLAGFVIVLLIGYQRRKPRETLWIVATTSTALAVTIAAITSIHGQLTVIHLVGLLLVFGLGLDYALFLSRPESAAEKRATGEALLACAGSTTLAFAILAASSIPILSFLGLTVAVGAASSYLLALGGSRLRRRPA